MIRHRAAGDLILTTPALRALRSGLPGTTIDILVPRGTGGILRGNPHVDRAIELDRSSLFAQMAWYATLATGRYDLVLDMVSNPRSAFMTALTRAPIRVGYALRGRSYAYTIRIPREPVGPDGPIARYAPECSLDFVRAIGLTPRGIDLAIYVDPEASVRIASWLEGCGLGSRPIVACLPSGTYPAKIWAADRYIAAMAALRDFADVVWLWGPGERELATRCARALNGSRLAPAMTWEELAALIQRCALLVSNDSGPKHLAVALDVPTVTIYGPSNPGSWQPPSGPHLAVEARGLECLHCNQTRCPLPGDRFMRCMDEVTVDHVVEACRAHLRERVRPA